MPSCFVLSFPNLQPPPLNHNHPWPQYPIIRHFFFFFPSFSSLFTHTASFVLQLQTWAWSQSVNIHLFYLMHFGIMRKRDYTRTTSERTNDSTGQTATSDPVPHCLWSCTTFSSFSVLPDCLTCLNAPSSYRVAVCWHNSLLTCCCCYYSITCNSAIAWPPWQVASNSQRLPPKENKRRKRKKKQL